METKASNHSSIKELLNKNGIGPSALRSELTTKCGEHSVNIIKNNSAKVKLPGVWKLFGHFDKMHAKDWANLCSVCSEVAVLPKTRENLIDIFKYNNPSGTISEFVDSLTISESARKAFGDAVRLLSESCRDRDLKTSIKNVSKELLIVTYQKVKFDHVKTCCKNFVVPNKNDAFFKLISFIQKRNKDDYVTIGRCRKFPSAEKIFQFLPEQENKDDPKNKDVVNEVKHMVQDLLDLLNLSCCDACQAPIFESLACLFHVDVLLDVSEMKDIFPQMNVFSKKFSTTHMWYDNSSKMFRMLSRNGENFVLKDNNGQQIVVSKKQFLEKNNLALIKWDFEAGKPRSMSAEEL